MLKYLLGSAVLVLFAGYANAQIEIGNDLVEYTREADKINMGDPSASPFDAGAYIGFVIGVYGAYHWTGFLCGVDQVTHGQAIAIVSRYLKANPAQWHLPAIGLVRDALQSAFPCPK
jgi:hypothetical protein